MQPITSLLADKSLRDFSARTSQRFKDLIESIFGFSDLQEAQSNLADIDLGFLELSKAIVLFSDELLPSDCGHESLVFSLIPTTSHKKADLIRATKAINREIMTYNIVFFIGDDAISKEPSLSISFATRRENKLNNELDVLESIILIKDIHLTHPSKAHRKNLESIAHNLKPRNIPIDTYYGEIFALLSIKALQDEFYTQITRHFTEILESISLPSDTTDTGDKDKRTFTLRLISRILFAKFLEKKGILDSKIFDTSLSEEYYHEVLEPLFFTTLNTPQDKRDYANLDSKVIHLLESIPYLNGGLFAPSKDDFYSTSNSHINTLKVPNAPLQALFTTLESYHFTLDENSPKEQEIGLDPEMLGMVFESLLSVLFTDNADKTKQISNLRKTTGSYYTPREIVEYMVQSAIIEYLETKCESIDKEKIHALVKDSNIDSPSLADGARGRVNPKSNLESKETIQQDSKDISTSSQYDKTDSSRHSEATAEESLHVDSKDVNSTSTQSEKPPLASGSLQKTSNDGALAHDFESVVGGRGESRERGGGERLRNLSPFPLSQNQEQIEGLDMQKSKDISHSLNMTDTRHCERPQEVRQSQPPHLTQAEQTQILEALLDMKVLDPACGSGAFPMGILNTLCEMFDRLDPQAQYTLTRDSSLGGHSACSEFCGSASAHSLRCMPDTSHSLASHNPQNSSTILECQQDSALGSHSSDFENFESSQTSSLASPSKFSKSTQSTTANTRIFKNNQTQTLESSQNTQTLIAQQGANPKRSEIITPLDCRKEKAEAFVFSGLRGEGGINPFSFCDERLKALENLRSENNTAQNSKDISHSLNMTDTSHHKRESNLLQNRSKPTLHQEMTPHYIHKLYILQNIIYGVDIQPMATEISRLRAFLCLIIDEDSSHITALPNLEFKFISANSLLPLPKSEGLNYAGYEEDIASLHALQAQTFASHDKKKLESSYIALRDKIARESFATTRHFDTNPLLDYNPFDSTSVAPFFDSEFMFGVKAFDVVIGNPPYIRQQRIKDLKPMLSKIFKIYNGQSDIYIYFFEQGFNILKNNGVLIFITSNKWIKSEYGQHLRKFLLANTSIIDYIECGKVFENANVETSITSFAKYKANKNYAINFCRAETPQISTFSFTKIPYDSLGGSAAWIFDISDNSRVINKIQSLDFCFYDIVEKIAKGSSSGNDGLYIFEFIAKQNNLYEVESKIGRLCIESDILAPFIYGEDIQRFAYTTTTKYILYPYDKKTNKLIPYNDLVYKYPKAFEYLQSIKPTLMERRFKMSDTDFYKFSALRNAECYINHKIMIPDMLTYPRFGFDNIGLWHNAGIHSLKFKNDFLHLERMVFGILNSKLFWFFIKHTSTALSSGTYRLMPLYLAPFRFPKLDSSNQTIADEIIALVEKILESKSKDSTCDTSELESKIDELVYKLYNLDSKEIEIVENN